MLYNFNCECYFFMCNIIDDIKLMLKKDASTEKNWTRWFLGDAYGYGLGHFCAPWSMQTLTGWLFNWQTSKIAIL